MQTDSGLASRQFGWAQQPLGRSRRKPGIVLIDCRWSWPNLRLRRLISTPSVGSALQSEPRRATDHKQATLLIRLLDTRYGRHSKRHPKIGGQGLGLNHAWVTWPEYDTGAAFGGTNLAELGQTNSRSPRSTPTQTSEPEQQSMAHIASLGVHAKIELRTTPRIGPAMGDTPDQYPKEYSWERCKRHLANNRPSLKRLWMERCRLRWANHRVNPLHLWPESDPR